jgi:hypothetical protein
MTANNKQSADKLKVLQELLDQAREQLKYNTVLYKQLSQLAANCSITADWLSNKPLSSNMFPNLDFKTSPQAAIDTLCNFLFNHVIGFQHKETWQQNRKIAQVLHKLCLDVNEQIFAGTTRLIPEGLTAATSRRSKPAHLRPPSGFSTVTQGISRLFRWCCKKLSSCFNTRRNRQVRVQVKPMLGAVISHPLPSRTSTAGRSRATKGQLDPRRRAAAAKNARRRTLMPGTSPTSTNGNGTLLDDGNEQKKGMTPGS